MISLPKPNSDVCFMCGEERRQYYAYYNGIKFYVCYDGSCGERNQKLWQYAKKTYMDKEDASKKYLYDGHGAIKGYFGTLLILIKNGLNLLLCL